MRKPKRGQNMDKALKIIWLIQFEELQQELFMEMRKRYKTGTGCSAVVVINRIVHSRWLPNLWKINKVVWVRRCLSAIDSGEYLLSGEAYRLFFEFLVSPRNYIQSLTEVLYRTHGASYHKIYFHIFPSTLLSIIAIELTLLTQGARARLRKIWLLEAQFRRRCCEANPFLIPSLFARVGAGSKRPMWLINGAMTQTTTNSQPW